MDIAPDRESGRTTTAVRIGAVRTKLLIAAILSLEVVLVIGYFRDLVIAGCLVAGAVWFAADACWLWQERPYSAKTMKLFMYAWNAAAVLLIAWDYSRATLTRAVH